MAKKVISYLAAAAAVFVVAGVAFAEGGEGGVTGAVKDWTVVLVPISIAIAVAAGATGQSKAAMTALEGIARNPNAADKMFVPMLLGLALMESLVLLAWLQLFLVKGMF